MGDSTGILWTDHTFNPWMGCEKVSPACLHCYAEGTSKRAGFGSSKPGLWGRDAHREPTGDAYWRRPISWDRMAREDGRPHLVFCASMADVFEARADLDPLRARLWAVIEETPHLIWQLLTKRPERIAEQVPARWLIEPGNFYCDRCRGSASLPLGATCDEHRPRPTGWPRHVWIGTTVENDLRAAERIPPLLRIPAEVRFLSCEPLLGPVSLDRWLLSPILNLGRTELYGDPPTGAISWLIVGGESGPGHRNMDPSWARSLRDDAERAEVAFFFKQWGGLRSWSGGHELDGELLQAFPEQAGDRSDGGPWAVRDRRRAERRAQRVEIR